MVLYDAILNGRDGLYVGENSECLGERPLSRSARPSSSLACAAPMNGRRSDDTDLDRLEKIPHADAKS